MANLSNINNKFIVTDGGHVSIGATTTTYPLTVESGGVGTVLRAGTSFVSIDSVGSAASPSLIFNGDSNTGIFRAAADTLAFSTAGSERMRIDSSGIVKINTTAVNARFRVDEGGTGEWVAGFKHTGTTPYGVFIDTSVNTSTGYTFGCYTNTGTGLFVKNDGKVGIGETNPAHKLSIKATDDTRGILVNNTLTTSYAEVALKASREFRMGTGGSASDTSARDRWYVYDKTATAHRLTLDSSGNFGIGTTTPSSKLHVQSTANADVVFKLDNTNVADTAGAQIQLICDSAGSGDGNGALRHSIRSEFSGAINWEIHSGASHGDLNFSCLDSFAMIINSELDVGIGTSSPVKKLQVSDSATGLMTNLLLTNTHDTNGDTTGIAFSMTDNDLYNKAGIVFERQTTQGRGSLHFCNNNTNGSANFTLADAAMTIEYTGEVGIGTTAPTSQLFVNNTADGDKIRWGRSDALVGSVGTYNGVPYIGYQGGAGGGIMFNGSSIEPTALGSTRSSSTNDIGSANYLWRNIYLSGGAYLGGTGSASVLKKFVGNQAGNGAQWTPTVTTNQGTSPTISSSSGYYQQVGNVVTVSFEFTMSNPTVGAGSVVINNLPIAIADTNHVSGCGVIPTLGKTINVRHHTATNQIAMNFYDGNYCGTAYRTVGTVTYWAAT